MSILLIYSTFSKKTMGKDDLENLFGLAVGALLGYAIVKALFGERIPCPNCRNPIQKNTSQCPYCKVWLGWRWYVARRASYD